MWQRAHIANFHGFVRSEFHDLAPAVQLYPAKLLEWKYQAPWQSSEWNIGLTEAKSVPSAGESRSRVTADRASRIKLLWTRGLYLSPDDRLVRHFSLLLDVRDKEDCGNSQLKETDCRGQPSANSRHGSNS